MEQAKEQWKNEYTQALDSKQKQQPALTSDPTDTTELGDVKPRRRRILTQPKVGEGEELQLLADLDEQIARICTELEAEGGQQGGTAVDPCFSEKQGGAKAPRRVLGAELAELDRKIGTFLAAAAR